MEDIFDDIENLVKKVATYCTECNPEKGVINCRATGCVNKKLYSLLIQCLCEEEKALKKGK